MVTPRLLCTRVEVCSEDRLKIWEVLGCVLLHRVRGVVVPLDRYTCGVSGLLDAEVEPAGAGEHGYGITRLHSRSLPCSPDRGEHL